MRLICGILKLDGSHASAEMLTQMCEAMQSDQRTGHYEVWRDGPAGLGVLGFGSDETGGLQLGQDSALAADVRLDEPEKLAAGVGLDPEIALATLDRLGLEAPLAMLGDFALAYWRKGAQELLLARDAMGVRPLVYHSQPGKFLVFASFPIAIHASGLLPRELNEEAFVHLLTARARSDETLSRGVLALPPGHMLHASSRGVTLDCYWRPKVQSRRHRNPMEAAEELRELMQLAVRSRVRGTGPVAAHLSGGLDSSAIAILAARELRPSSRQLLTYSFLPDENMPAELQGERPFVEAVLAQEPGILCKPIPPSHGDARRRHPMQADRAISIAEDDPDNAVCLDASHAGAEMVLSGWGGDEGVTFNGRGALADAFLRLRWRYLAKEIGALKRQRKFSTRGVLYGDVLTPILPQSLLGLLERARGRVPGKALTFFDLLKPGLRGRMQAEKIEILQIGSNVRKNQLGLLSSGHISQRTTNWASIGARYGLAFAFPLLDRRVVEFALSLPTTWHLREGYKRRPFRDAMAGVLPEKIQWRHDKLTPYPDSIFKFEEQRKLVMERVDELSRHPVAQQIFNFEQVRKLVLDLPEPHALRTYEGRANLSFMMVAVALQYGRYVEEHF